MTSVQRHKVYRLQLMLEIYVFGLPKIIPDDNGVFRFRFISLLRIVFYTYWMQCSLFLHYGYDSVYVAFNRFQTHSTLTHCIQQQQAIRQANKNSMKNMDLQFNKPSPSRVTIAQAPHGHEVQKQAKAIISTQTTQVAAVHNLQATLYINAAYFCNTDR